MKILKLIIFITLNLNLYSCTEVKTLNQYKADQASKYDHQFLKINFPIKIDDFSRLFIAHYDKIGANLSGQYINKSDLKSPIMISVYIYPIFQPSSPKTIKDHFAGIKNAIIMKQPSASMISEKKVNLIFRGQALEGYKAQYKIYEKFFKEVEGQQKLISVAELYTFNQWHIKFRITYMDNKSQNESKKFIEEFKKRFLEINSIAIVN